MDKQLKVLVGLLFLVNFLPAVYLRSSEMDYSPKALALGSSQVALADSVDLLRYNTAGLTKISSDRQIYSSSLQGFLGQTIFLGYAQRLSQKETLGVLLGTTVVEGINQVEWQYDRPLVVGKKDYFSNELMVAYSFLLNDRLAIGAALRAGYKFWGTLYGLSLAMDCGVVYQLNLPHGYQLNTGINFSDIGNTNFHWKSGHDETIPFLTVAGVALTKKLRQAELGLVIDTELDQYCATSFGLFCKLFDGVTFRIGKNESDQLCYGAGVDIFGCQIDYAQAKQQYLGEQKQISLRINF